MGTAISNTRREQVADIVNTNVNEVVSEAINDMDTSASASSTINIHSHGVVHLNHCDISEKARMKIQNISQLFSNKSSTTINQITNKLTSVIEKKITLQNEGLNFAQTAVVNDVDITKQVLHTIVSSVAKNIVRSSSTIHLQNNQVINITSDAGVDCDDSTISTDFDADTITNLLNKSVADDIIKNQTLTDIFHKYKLEETLSNKGIDPTMIIMAVVALIVMIIAGRFMMKK